MKSVQATLFILAFLINQSFTMALEQAKDVNLPDTTNSLKVESNVKEKISNLAKTNELKIFRKRIGDQASYLILYKDKNQSAVETTPSGVNSKARWFTLATTGVLASFGLGNAFYNKNSLSSFDNTVKSIPARQLEFAGKAPGVQVEQIIVQADSDGKFTDFITHEVKHTYGSDNNLESIIKVKQERIENESGKLPSYPFMNVKVQTQGGAFKYNGDDSKKIDFKNRKSFNQEIKNSLIVSSVFILYALADLGFRQNYGHTSAYKFVFYFGGHQQTKKETKWIANNLDQLMETIPSSKDESLIFPILPLHFELVASELVNSMDIEPVSVEEFLSEESDES